MATLSKIATVYTVLVLPAWKAGFSNIAEFWHLLGRRVGKRPVELRLAGFHHLAAASRVSDEPPLARRGDEWRQRDRRACRHKAGPGF